MVPRLYYHIVELMQRYRTWVRVIDTEQRIPVSFLRGQYAEIRYVQSLTLQCITDSDGFRSGHFWRIPLCDLQMGIHLWSKMDPSFVKRASIFSLTLNDVNHITEISTHGRLRLRLEE